MGNGGDELGLHPVHLFFLGDVAHQDHGGSPPARSLAQAHGRGQGLAGAAAGQTDLGRSRARARTDLGHQPGHSRGKDLGDGPARHIPGRKFEQGQQGRVELDHLSAGIDNQEAVGQIVDDGLGVGQGILELAGGVGHGLLEVRNQKRQFPGHGAHGPGQDTDFVVAGLGRHGRKIMVPDLDGIVGQGNQRAGDGAHQRVKHSHGHHQHDQHQGFLANDRPAHTAGDAGLVHAQAHLAGAMGNGYRDLEKLPRFRIFRLVGGRSGRMGDHLAGGVADDHIAHPFPTREAVDQGLDRGGVPGGQTVGDDRCQGRGNGPAVGQAGVGQVVVQQPGGEQGCGIGRDAKNQNHGNKGFPEDFGHG